MNVALRHRIMRIEDFLAWEARQDTRFEFDGFEPVAMAGGSANHAAIQRNLAISVGARLRGTSCHFFGSDMKVITSERSRYPDAQVVCSRLAGSATFTTAPVVLFEVISPGDEARDRVEKAADYRTIASVRRYVILEQEQVAATVMTPHESGWSVVMLGPLDVLSMPELGIEVPMFELYEGVELTPSV